MSALRHYVPGHSTLLAITVFTPALSGCLLLLSWLQHRRVTALALWGWGFITASVATTLIIVLRGTIPDFWSIIVGNALLAAAYGILWCGARKFDGKKHWVAIAWSRHHIGPNSSPSQSSVHSCGVSGRPVRVRMRPRGTGD
jgi:hypothetical protein